MEAMGTGLAGYIDISYEALRKKLGSRFFGPSDDYKTEAEWIIVAKVSDKYGVRNVVTTIYNYKTGITYMGAKGTRLKEERDWHIGGNRESVEVVRKLFPRAKVRHER